MSKPMRGRVCLVTGASNGIGKAAAVNLATLGASLVLLCRDRERGEKALAEISRRSGSDDIDLLLADLGSLRQVRDAAAAFLESGRPLHVLVNNAGALHLTRRVTEDGFETTFAVNHLGHFLLTNLLIGRMQKNGPARIVTVASEAHRIGYGDGRIAFDDLMGERAYGGWKAYGQSKLANILFTHELARRLDPALVTANAMHPGVVASQFGRNNGKGWLAVAQALYRPFCRSNEKGADTAVWLAAAPELEGVTGSYFKDRKPLTPAPQALEDEDAERLWRVSADLTGLTAR
jgi:NAD(P)-dependent dehydrogenase (short-subunit alcohol dehydrogenase family)